MKRRHFLATIPAAALAAPNALTPQERQAGWQLLFDGVSFTNWSLSRLKQTSWWKIEDGWIQSIPQGASREGRRLVTLDTFQDFELTFDWKVSHEGNSGVKYRIQRVWTSDPELPVKPSLDQLMINTALGFEYQIADDENEPTAKQTPLSLTGALYGLLPPKNRTPVRAGSIHSTRIVVTGSHFEHWLDAIKVLEGDLTSPAVKAALHAKRDAGIKQRDATDPQRRYEAALAQHTAESLLRYDIPASPIDFQHHRSGIAFRNIKIRQT